MARKDKIRINAFITFTGLHPAAWRDEGASSGFDFEDYLELARIAEAAKLDAVFLADGVAVPFNKPKVAAMAAHNGIRPFEPITLLSAMAVATKNIGLIATASTSFYEPYNVARLFASLDRLSKGRTGWNLVTSSDPYAALNFGMDTQSLHADRYARAEEFADVVTGLWDSYEDDTFLRDRAAGQYLDPEKVHLLNHKGAHLSVRGPLNVPRSPQGRPVLVQAGASEAGKQLAARTAEAVFSAHDTNETAVAFYKDLKDRMPGFGRDPSQLKVMSGIMPVVGETKMEAEDRFAKLQDLIQPELGLDRLEGWLGGVDLSKCDLDGPLPEMTETNREKSRQELLINMARRENLTIRQLYKKIAGNVGHYQVIGTAKDVADAMEERFESYGTDGFSVMSEVFPADLRRFATMVVPELQRRGLFRTEYEGRTLRENLGLNRPANQFAA